MQFVWQLRWTSTGEGIKETIWLQVFYIVCEAPIIITYKPGILFYYYMLYNSILLLLLYNLYTDHETLSSYILMSRMTKKVPK